MLKVPTQLRANLESWKSNPNTDRRLPATVLPPFGPPTRDLDRIATAREQDNNPAFDSDPRIGTIVAPQTGDTVTLSTQDGDQYFQEVKADGDVTAMLQNSTGVHRVSYYRAEGQSDYSSVQSYVPMNGEGWHALRDVKA